MVYGNHESGYCIRVPFEKTTKSNRMNTQSYPLKNKLVAIAGALALAGCLPIHAAISVGNSTPPPTVSIIASDRVALEGTSSGSFTLLFSDKTTGYITVNLGVSGTATNGLDYGPISTNITVPPGTLAVDIPIVPLIDLVNRGNKSVVLTVLSNSTSYNVLYRSKAKVEIIDDTYNITPPTISLTSPSEGAVFTAPAVITLTAAASDPDVPISSVSFYANDNFLGKVTSKPYSLTITNKYPGHFALFARAVDSVDQSTVSAPVHITVNSAPPVTTSTPRKK